MNMITKLGFLITYQQMQRFVHLVGASALAERMAQLSPLTQRLHKQMLQTVLHKPDLSQLSTDETAAAAAVFDSEDHAEGIRSFAEKRSPQFSGR